MVGVGAKAPAFQCQPEEDVAHLVAGAPWCSGPRGAGAKVSVADDVCGRSTAAPSPALTAASSAASPLSSPSRIYADRPVFAEPDHFLLPDAEDGPEPEFTLSGIEALQESVLGLLSKRSTHAAVSGDGHGAGGAVADGPPAAAPPLPPPGLEGAWSPEPPPGLEAAPADAAPTAPVSAPNAEEGGSVQQAAAARASWPPVLPAGCTTVMLRNIPNKYTQEMLVTKLHEGGYRLSVDFVYVPIDFRNKCNVGYAFLNFRTAKACMRFASEYHLADSREKLPGFRSQKVCEVCAAVHQGCADNVKRIRGSPVLVHLVAKPEWLPLLFDEAGEAVSFPVPANLQAGGQAPPLPARRPRLGEA